VLIETPADWQNVQAMLENLARLAAQRRYGVTATARSGGFVLRHEDHAGYVIETGPDGVTRLVGIEQGGGVQRVEGFGCDELGLKLTSRATELVLHAKATMGNARFAGLRVIRP
jgi:hypothetical protein